MFIEYELENIKKKIFGGRKELNRESELVARAGVQREEGYLYFIDENGNVARAPMDRGGKKK